MPPLPSISRCNYPHVDDSAGEKQAHARSLLQNIMTSFAGNIQQRIEFCTSLVYCGLWMPQSLKNNSKIRTLEIVLFFVG
jgi:hypothetical protein